MLRMEIALFLVLCAVLLFGNWRSLDRKKRFAIGAALVIEFTVCALQGLHHTRLISSMGLTLMALALYLTLENPDILRGELTEQKLSMLYLKSQINPHFLYNTLDAIRIQAQLDGDKPVADLLMRLVDFFRLSVKVDRPMVTLDDELELLECDLPVIKIRVVCSKGTYIRALARDIGKALGSGAHLIGLERTRIGEVTLDMCMSPEEIDDFLEKNVVKIEEEK